MHKVSLIKWENIHLAAPNPPFESDVEVDMRFSSVRYPARQLLLYVHGTVAKGPEKADEQYGGQWSFYFSPDSADLDGLCRLEELLQPSGPNSQRLLEEVEFADLAKHYEFRETLNENNQLRIKLRKQDMDWKFNCSAPMTEDTVQEDLKKGTSVTLTLAPGFYFSDSNNRYGLYLTLKELKFNEQAEIKTPMKAPLKIAKRVKTK